ncbi:MAG TPA: alpha-2-macroglobulin family protein [Chthoniobacterales bacterium]|nr:alpha-2-macroglobulin family protein [Chthoniobacterales bacterium]
MLDAKSRKPLPYLKVFRVGKTVPLSVDWVGAFNHPLEDPAIIIKFNDIIEPSEATPENIRIEPAIKDIKLLPSSDEIRIAGAFDLKQRYQVAVSTNLRGARGFGLTNESRWGATFRDKQPTILFPASQVFLRAGAELRFSFFQVNTPAVTWKLAAIPLEKLPAITTRVREFERDTIDPVTGKPVIDPRTGFNKPYRTEPLVDAFQLPVIATGSTDATGGNTNTRRDIKCALPPDKTRSGAFLLEATAQLPDGRVVGNRSIICTSDLILTQKRTPNSVMLRVAKMATAQPIAGITVRALTKENIELARAVTDKDGFAAFERTTVLPQKKDQAYLFVAESDDGTALQFVDGAFYYGAGDSDYSPARHDSHVEIITDRNLYRPGQVVKMKGMVRRYQNGEPVIPNGSQVRWKITSGSDEIKAEGTAALSRRGGWEAEWTIPETSELGELQIRCAIENQDIFGGTTIQVEEYRVPLFFVTVDANEELGQTAHAQVRSVYFHGAPNTGARVHWSATWSAFAEFGSEEDDYRKRYNGYSQLGPHLDPNESLTKTIEGDAVLDDRGAAALSCESPFKDNAAVSRAHVSWSVEVTSIDGQTLPGGQTTTVFAVPTRLGIKIAEQPGANRAVKVQLDAVDQKNVRVADIPVRVDLFHVTTKTAKEQIAPFVYRYRNTDQFEKVASRQVKTPDDFDFPVTATGRYVAAASATDGKSVMVSDETTVTGEQIAELPVPNETSFKIEHESRQFSPGEKARLTIQAPFGGMAWVSVENDRILDTLIVPLAGNAGRIDLPIKREFAPNANVSIYLIKPGGDRELPRERFASTAIEVRRPERELKIESHLAATTVKPGETVHGTVQVSSENKPVKDADLTVFATDDAVLTLGNWKLPDLISEFYPKNPFSVRSYQSLDRFIEQITPTSLTQKGFILGGGEEAAVSGRGITRKEFKTLAFWQGSLTTDDNGKASFEFVAPDNLTTYRIVAVAQAKADQFGGDANTTLKTSKPLLINPALPRFLRHQDELELRASVQQNFSDSEQVTMRCVTDSTCPLIAEATQTREAKRDTPTVFRFKAKVENVELAPTKIRFEAVAKSDSKMTDAVELTLPVQPPTIVRKESVAGSFSGPRFDAEPLMPGPWKTGHGKFDATISSSPWLPKLAGIPAVLDYPHGCFEQICTKLLGYSMLANLLAYLPNVEARDAEYRGVLERGMKQINDSLLGDGMLPYWPGGDTANPFVTCEAFWAVNESANAGFSVPDKLRDKLAGALKKIIEGRTNASVFDKCFALFVLSQYQTSDDINAIAQDLYLRRNEADDEGRALLAIALHRQKIMAREREQLLKEISAPVKPRAFKPSNFSSTTRAEAIIALAFDTVAPKMWNAERKKRVKDRMLALMDSSASLSTQENLWLLLAFKSMLETEIARPLTAMQPAGKLSRNSCSAAWLDRSLGQDLSITGLNHAALTFLLSAQYATNDLDTQRSDRGFRLERVVRNMSDPKRTGETNAPFKIGDQVLITYRINTERQHSYVALEDALPGGFEVVNPNLALIGRFLQMPAPDPSDHVLALSHSEMRDRTTLLYFDDFEPGTGIYSVLARATAAGTFRWPATQIYPMYDSRFSGLSPSSLCVISGE